MRQWQRIGAALVTTLAITALPARPTTADPPVSARELIPCLYPASGVSLAVPPGDRLFLSTDLLMVGSDFAGSSPHPGAQVVDGVAIFPFDSVSVSGDLVVSGSRPAVLLSRSTIEVQGTVFVRPGEAGGGVGNQNGFSGVGPGGGAGDPGDGSTGGGGGGFGGKGGNGGGGAPGGAAYGDLRDDLQGGSGGGSGAADKDPGGDGGGALALVANASITVNGVVDVTGASADDRSDGGGGGSGGGLVLRAPVVSGSGTVQAFGGAGDDVLSNLAAPGGGGGGGRVLIARNSGSIANVLVHGGPGGSQAVGVVSGQVGATGSLTTTGLKLKTVKSWPALVRGSTSWDLNSTFLASTFVQDFTYGTKPLVPFTGDWNGDGIRTPGYYNAGTFHLRDTNDATSTEQSFAFGDARGFVVVGDWNGDGLDDVATYLNGVWKTRTTGCATTSTFNFGTGNWPSTVPVAGDWNGDGISGVGTYALASGVWTIRETPAGTNTTIAFPGVGNFYPVVGDWNGDGTDSIGVKTMQGPTWFLRNTNATASGGDPSFDFGAPSDLPLSWSVPAP